MPEEELLDILGMIRASIRLVQDRFVDIELQADAVVQPILETVPGIEGVLETLHPELRDHRGVLGHLSPDAGRPAELRRVLVNVRRGSDAFDGDFGDGSVRILARYSLRNRQRRKHDRHTNHRNDP